MSEEYSLYILIFLRDSRILDMFIPSNLVSVRCDIQIERFSDGSRKHMSASYILDQPSTHHPYLLQKVSLSLSLTPSHPILSDFRPIRNAIKIANFQPRTIAVLETPYTIL